MNIFTTPKKKKSIDIEKLDDGYILKIDGKTRAISGPKQLNEAVHDHFVELTERMTRQDSRVSCFRLEMSFEENPVKDVQSNG